MDSRVTSLSDRATTVWKLGYPEAALADADQALTSARELGHAGPLMFALIAVPRVHIFCGNYGAAGAQVDEAAALAEERGAQYWKALAILVQGCILALSGDASEAVHSYGSTLPVLRAMGANLAVPHFLAHLALAHAHLGQFHDASEMIGEAIAAMEKSGEKWHAADIYRIAGEITLLSPDQETAMALVHFERALEKSRAQQAKSWELRAATSMARVWRDQSKRQQALELLSPIYKWFTEGFDTRDLKEAKALLDEIAA
jgi:predicted ATPase